MVLGGHDYLCGALPAGVFRPGAVLDVTGTWEIVAAALPEPILTPRALELGVVVESHVARGMYSAMCASVAADMLEWFRNGICAAQKPDAAGAGPDWEPLIEEARRSPPGAHGAMFLPHMAGSTCPRVDPRSLGAFVGLRTSHTRGDLVRAMFEGLDFQFLEILQALETGLGTRAEKIVAVGGAVRNGFWMQNKADVVGKPIEVPAIEEATPLGAAILAGIGLGIYKDEQDAWSRVHRPGRVYEPNGMCAQRYAEGFQVYRQLYPSLKDVHGSIFGSA